MKLMQDSKDAKAKSKSLKPQVERRRRARMNRSLDTLKSLLLRQAETRRRLEKAEILERTILFLQNTAKGPDTTAGAGGGGGGEKHSFQDGFSTCLQKAVRFLGPEGKGLRLGAALDASFAARFANTDSAGVQNTTAACSSPNSMRFRKSSIAVLQMLIHRSGYRLCAPALNASSCLHTWGQSIRSSTTPQQLHRTGKRTNKQSPPQSHSASVCLWRPWP